MPAFKKQNYETIAEVLRSVRPTEDKKAPLAYGIARGQWENTCLAFLNHLRQDNPAFDGDRFLAACKGEAKRGNR